MGDTLFIDLTDPPVFECSNENIGYSFGVNTGLSSVDMNRLLNPNDNGNYTLIIAVGLEKGTSILSINSFSDCLENSTTFTVNVIEQ